VLALSIAMSRLGRVSSSASAPKVAGTHVTAVLVTFDAARWLPATLGALAELDTLPSRLIAIDNASTDATRTLLDRAHDQGVLDAVYDGKREFGFGAAVQAALELDAANLQEDADTLGFRAISATDSRWLWLLHDDAVPAPDALYQLLAHVTTDESIDLTGPKLLLPRRRHGGQPISEVGVSISGTGRRELDLDVDEIDQGQRDEPQERLGVSTCGRLARTPQRLPRGHHTTCAAHPPPGRPRWASSPGAHGAQAGPG
jgi:GT2 family glycosyltransferase